MANEGGISDQSLLEWNSKLGSICSDFLVKAKVFRQDDERPQTLTWMKIDEVFCGPPSLSGRIFLVISPVSPPEGSGPFCVYPAPTPGTVGIWRLRLVNKRLCSYPSSNFFYGIPLPAYEEDSDNYRKALSFCKAIEEVVETSGHKKRIVRLQQLALEQNPDVARWAVKVLANEKLDGITHFFQHLIGNEKPTMAAQICADRAMIDLNREAWQYSDKRLTAIKKWTTRKLSETEAMELRTYFWFFRIIGGD